MNTLNTTWLESLVQHSIFDLNETEKQLVGKFKSKTTRNENATVDYLRQHHNQVMALCDNFLYVAVGATIRVINLSTYKEQCSNNNTKVLQSTHYKLLDTPDIKFTIESLIPNKNGKLLAVKGENCLSVVCLPRHGFAHSSQKNVECRTLSVGTTHYSDSKIIKVEWHPLSENDTHLVVLCENNVLRLFDISVDLELPEQHFNLSPDEPLSTSIKLISANRNKDVVSFSLGGISRDQSLWEPFTIFYTLREGSMYALSPIIPYRSCLRRNHLENLISVTKTKYEQAKKSDSHDNKAMSYLFQLQLSWISQLLQSAKIFHKMSVNGAEGNVLLVSSHEQHSVYPVQRQGPFVVSETSADGEVSDILYINYEPVHLLVVAATNGTVKNYMLCSDIDARWQIAPQSEESDNATKLREILSMPDYSPKASLIESISLTPRDTPKYQAMTLVADPLYEDTYFVYHTTGVHAVSTNKWIQTLRLINSSFESGDEEEAQLALDSWMKKHTQSDVRIIIDSSPFKDEDMPIIGLVAISDMYLSYSLLAITADYQLVTTELFIRREPELPQKLQEAVKETLKHVADEVEDQSLLSLPIYKVPALTESLPRLPKVVIPGNISSKDRIVINKETVDFLTHFSERVRSESSEIKKSVAKIQTRLLSQQYEFERQVKSLKNLDYKLKEKTSNEAKEALEQKLKSFLENHNKLQSRINQQARLVMRNSEQKLSEDEELWIKEIETISERVNGEEGYAKKVNMLKSQLDKLQSGVKKADSSSSDLTQLKSTLHALQKYSITIKSIEDRVKDLEAKVSTSAA